MTTPQEEPTSRRFTLTRKRGTGAWRSIAIAYHGKPQSAEQRYQRLARSVLILDTLILGAWAAALTHLAQSHSLDPANAPISVLAVCIACLGQASVLRGAARTRSRTASERLGGGSASPRA